MENKLYAYWLYSTPGVGNRTIEKLQERLGMAERIYHSSQEEWGKVLKPALLEKMKQHKQNWQLQEEYDRMTGKGICFLLKEDKDYPKRLQTIPDAPYGIFVKGQLPAEDKLSVAIIGARDCSEYGRYQPDEVFRVPVRVASLGKEELSHLQQEISLENWMMLWRHLRIWTVQSMN